MRLVLTRTPRRLLPLVWVVTLLVASGAATPRLRAVHRDRAARATTQRLGVTRSGERARTIAPDPGHGTLSSHGRTGGEPRGPRRLAAVVPPGVVLLRPVALAADRPPIAYAPPPHWSARPRPARGPPA